jgi:SPP1 family phage portal protein
MTTGWLTQNQLIDLKLMSDRAQIDTSRIRDLIDTDLRSEFKREMRSGTQYYDARHDILDYLQYYWIDSVRQRDLVKTNNTIPHPFHKVLVDQKVAYIAGNPVLVSVSDDAADAGAFQEQLILWLDESFDDHVNDWLLGSCNKGVEWMHAYIDPKGDLRYCIVPAEQIIAVYDTQYQDELIYVIRFYVYDLIDVSGKSQQRYKIEWWSKEQVEYWSETVSGNFIHDPDYETNPAPHWWTFNTAKPGIKSSNSWGRVPFVPLPNNSQLRNDLRPIKRLIDAYDKVKSGWVNDLDDFSEMIYVLKGFTGLSSEATAGYSQLALFLQNLKQNKAVGVEADGAVTTLRSEIPVEAKEKFLGITRQEIFYFGEGVDVGDEKTVGAAPSGVALKFLYASLDMKANRMIRKLKTALKSFVWFVTAYINIRENKEYDSEQIIFTINKSMIFNEREKIDGINASKGVLSRRTMLENHPYVEDVEEELARIEAEKGEPVDEETEPEESEAGVEVETP